MSSDALRRRIDLLLRAYPPGYRAERGEEIAATMLDVAGPNRAWPTPREAGGVLLGAARVRARGAGIAPSILLRDAAQLAAVGITIPAVVYWAKPGVIGGPSVRGQLIAWGVGFTVLVALAVSSMTAAYLAGVVVLAGAYVAQQRRDELTVDAIPVQLFWSTEFYLVHGGLLGGLLLWRLAGRRRGSGRSHGAPLFSVVVVAVVTAAAPLLDLLAVQLPEGGAPWWHYQVRAFAPYLVLLAFAAVDPRIPMAGAALAVVGNAYMISSFAGPDGYGPRDMVLAAGVLGAALAVAAVLAVAGLLARRRLTRL